MKAEGSHNAEEFGCSGCCAAGVDLRGADIFAGGAFPKRFAAVATVEGSSDNSGWPGGPGTRRLGTSVRSISEGSQVSPGSAARHFRNLGPAASEWNGDIRRNCEAGCRQAGASAALHSDGSRNAKKHEAGQRHEKRHS